MRRVLVAMGVLVLAGAATVAQAQGPVLQGTVRSADGAPLAHAQVMVLTTGRGTLTDAAGRFTLRQLAPGRHRVEVALIGYAPERREVELPGVGEVVQLEVRLTPTPLALPAVQVTGTTGSRDPLAVAQATTQLSGRALERELSATVAHTLRMQPGLAMRSMGPAATLPVMRGLTGDRILVLQDGQRTADLSGSADDHGLTIEPLAAQRVEVVRGPATLLYGNNALGGVINVITSDIPGQLPRRSEWSMSAQTESAYPGGSAGLRYAAPLGERWALTVRGSGRSTADMRIPFDPVLGRRLDNTDARSWSAAAGLGYVGDAAQGGAAFRAYDFTYGLPVPPDADPVSLRGERFEGSGRAELFFRSARFPSLRVDGALQSYAHDEVDDLDGTVLQHFALDTRTLNLLLRQGRLGVLGEGAWGASGLFKTYAATGPEALTPPADSRGLGVFGFQEIPLGGPALELGGRFDEYRIGSRTSEKFGAARERVFRAVSGSAGLRVPVAAGVSASASLARSFRAPTVEELFSGAAHAGTGAVEFGDPELDAERGVALEAVVRVQNARWNGQFAAYRNRIDNYVHLAARGDTVVGGVELPVFVYAQDEAVLRGLEASLEWAATPALVLGAMGDVVRGAQADGTPLSFMPPPRVGMLARWDDGRFTLGGDVHHELTQDRVGAADEVPTPAHTILRAHAGVRLRLGGQHHSLVLRVENLTNALHREATSRIKDFAPGPGRNVAVSYRVYF